VEESDAAGSSQSEESQVDETHENAMDAVVEGDENLAPPRPVIAEIDADLAATLGRPKMAEKPSGNLGRLLGGKSMLGMSAVGSSQEEEELSDTSGLVRDYDEDSVKVAWSALVEDQKSKNKMGLAATLATGEWSFSDATIKLTVANQVQYDELKECATQLLHFVRTEVGNGSIALEVEVSEVEAAVEFLTPKDRYQSWVEENPALETMRRRLDLDLG
jgi:hypothetical protein